jgi:hypothetical protein
LDRRTELLNGVIIDMELVSAWHANIGDIPLMCVTQTFRSREKGILLLKSSPNQAST